MIYLMKFIRKYILNSFQNTYSMLTMKGCSILNRISFSNLIFSNYSLSIIISFLIHFIAQIFSVLKCYTKYTFPNVPLPIIFLIMKSVNLASSFCLANIKSPPPLIVLLSSCYSNYSSSSSSSSFPAKFFVSTYF